MTEREERREQDVNVSCTDGAAPTATMKTKEEEGLVARLRLVQISDS